MTSSLPSYRLKHISYGPNLTLFLLSIIYIIPLELLLILLINKTMCTRYTVSYISPPLNEHHLHMYIRKYEYLMIDDGSQYASLHAHMSSR